MTIYKNSEKDKH
jgi:hypothetical protein